MKNKKEIPSWEELREMFAETDKKFVETDRKLVESKLDLDSKFAKTDRKFAETREFIKELGKQIGGIGNSNGDFAEEFFSNGFENNMTVNGVKYDYLDQNKKRKVGNEKGEYDIVLINSDKILVLEVKYKLKNEQVENFYAKQLPKFKKLFPEYKNYTVHGGLAALSFDKNAQETAEKYGMYVFTQSGDSIKNISPENLELTSF